MSDLSVGFTGTQQGKTKAQDHQFRNLIRALRPKEFHHGCCIGSDVEAHETVYHIKMGTRLILHPPTDMSKVGNMTGVEWLNSKMLISRRPLIEILEAFDYMVRNIHIARGRSLLIATPKEVSEVQRSGTWATIRRAQRLVVPVLIITPKGDLVAR